MTVRDSICPWKVYSQNKWNNYYFCFKDGQPILPQYFDHKRVSLLLPSVKKFLRLNSYFKCSDSPPSQLITDLKSLQKFLKETWDFPSKTLWLPLTKEKLISQKLALHALCKEQFVPLPSIIWTTHKTLLNLNWSRIPRKLLNTLSVTQEYTRPSENHKDNQERFSTCFSIHKTFQTELIWQIKKTKKDAKNQELFWEISQKSLTLVRWSHTKFHFSHDKISPQRESKDRVSMEIQSYYRVYKGGQR